MLHWVADKIIAIVEAVPAMIVQQDSAHFELIRGMFGLLFILLVLLIIALRPWKFFFKRQRRD